MRFAAGAGSAMMLALAAFAQHQQQQQTSRVAIRGVTIVDVVRGQLSPDRNVTIAGDRIVSVTAGAGVAPGALQINGAGKYLMPGLWDMHATSIAGDPAALVARGVTGVRDMSSEDLDRTLSLYREIEAGKVVGPRLITGGPGIRAASPDEARAAFDRLFATDADFVRFHADLGVEAYIALAERSRNWRYPLAGPLPPSVRLRDAVSLRQASIEGIDGLDRLSREEACEGFKAAANAGVWFVPALASQRPRNRGKAQALVGLMRACGAPILAGAGVHDELQALVDAGFTPYEALRTATVEPARFLQSEETLGGVAAGKFADLVLLDGDPFEDIANLHRVAGVILRGRYYNAPAIAVLRRPPTIRTWTASTSAMPTPAASSAKPLASSARPVLPIR